MESSVLSFVMAPIHIPRTEYIARSFTKKAEVVLDSTQDCTQAWKGLSDLKFDISEAYLLAGGGGDLEVIRAKFANIIYRVFSVRGEVGKAPPLREFRLLFHYADNQQRCSQVRQWVRWAARLNCKKLDLSFLDEYWFMIHGGAKNGRCPTLQAADEPQRFNFCFSDVNNSCVADVCLRSCNFISDAVSNLDSIENISLHRMVLLTNEEIGQLISRCRKLRQFTLDGVSFHGTQILSIQSDVLERLTLRSHSCYDEETMCLSIEANGLISLNLIGFHMGSYVVDAPNLEEADVEFLDLSSPKTCENLDLIIQNLFGVRKLRFHNHDQGPLVQLYENLTYLELITKYHKTNILGLLEFLKASPHLETLVLNHTTGDDNGYSNFWDEDGYSVIVFHTPTLKTVIMKNYIKTQNEDYTVKLFKESAEVLECILAYPPQEADAILLWPAAPTIHD